MISTLKELRRQRPEWLQPASGLIPISDSPPGVAVPPAFVLLRRGKSSRQRRAEGCNLFGILAAASLERGCVEDQPQRVRRQMAVEIF
jgi:hypothetical protein